MKSHELFAEAALRCRRNASEVEAVFTAIANIIQEKIAKGEHVHARPLAVFAPAPKRRHGRRPWAVVKPYAMKGGEGNEV